MKKRKLCFLMLLLIMVLCGCKKEEPKPLEVYSFSGGNEQITVSNGVIILNDAKETFNGGDLTTTGVEFADITSYSTRFYILSGTEKHYFHASRLEDRTGDTVQVSGGMGSRWGENVLSKNMPEDGSDWKNNFYFELVTKNKAGKETVYQLQMHVEEVTKDASPETDFPVQTETVIEEEVSETPFLSPEEYPKVDGSTATIPLSQSLYQAATGASPEEAEASVSHSKTTNAYLELIRGAADLVIAYEPSEAVFEQMEKQQVSLRMEPIGRDALVFLINSGNPVKDVTSDELRKIYSGKITNWKELGGNDQELAAFQRPENSGSQTLMEKLVMKDTPMMEAPISRTIGEMGELIEAVAAYDQSDNALGYSVYYYARNMYQKPELSFLAVNGVMPSGDTIQNGTYPFINEFYAVIREDEPEDSPAGKLFSWLAGEGGQKLVEKTGYVPVRPSGASVGENQDVPIPDKSYLEEDQRLCIDGSFLDGIPRLVVFDGRFQKVMEDDRYKPVVSWQICKTTEPLLLESLPDEGRAKRGLYCLEERRWFLEPEYEVLWQEDENSKKGTWLAEKEEHPYTVTWKKDAGTVEVNRRSTDLKLGSFFWHEAQPGTYHIREGDGDTIRTVDLSLYGRKQFYTVIGDHVLFDGSRADGSGWQAYFDSQGNLLLDPEQMRQKNMASLTWASPQWGWVLGYPLMENGSPGSEPFVYSLLEQRFLTRPEDQVFADMWKLQRYFKIQRDGLPLILDENGEPVCSEDGKTCTDLIGDGYFGIREQETMRIIKGAGGPVVLTLPCREDQQVSHVTGSVFSVGDNGWSGRFYRGEELLLENGYDHSLKNWCILNGTEDSEKISMVLDEMGEILYQSELGEDIQAAFPEFILSYRGNYWNLVAYDGTVLMKGLQGYLGDD